jgi:hypothetical protein
VISYTLYERQIREWKAETPNSRGIDRYQIIIYGHTHEQETKGRSRVMTWKWFVQTIISTSCYIIVVSPYLSVTGTNNPSNPPLTFPWPSFHTTVWSRRLLLGQNHQIAFASRPLTSFQILFLIFFRSVI